MLKVSSRLVLSLICFSSLAWGQGDTEVILPTTNPSATKPAGTSQVSAGGLSDQIQGLIKNRLRSFVAGGGYYPNGLDTRDNNLGFTVGSEYRFYEPFFGLGEISYSTADTYLGLRERGGLSAGRTKSGGIQNDASFSEWRFALLGGLELTPQDGIIHALAGVGPAYRLFRVRETRASLEGRPPLSGSKYDGSAWGLQSALQVGVDITKQFTLVGIGRWMLTLNNSAEGDLEESPVLEGSSRRPGLRPEDDVLFSKNALSWGLGAQYNF